MEVKDLYSENYTDERAEDNKNERHPMLMGLKNKYY